MTLGLTPRMKQALETITRHVALHGAMPSRRVLAKAMGCNANNAQRLIARLVERGELHALSQGGALGGFGASGVSVFLPAHIASELAAFCAEHGERLPEVVADAVALHLDQVQPAGLEEMPA